MRYVCKMCQTGGECYHSSQTPVFFYIDFDSDKYELDLWTATAFKDWKH